MKSIEKHKAVTDEEKILLKRCVSAIKKIDPSAEVIFYGSRARGDAQPDSDYDLLILVDGDVNLGREDIICRQLYAIELETGKVLSAMVYSRQQWSTPLYSVTPLHKNIERDGVSL